MKNIKIIMVLLSILLCASCDKKSNEEGPYLIDVPTGVVDGVKLDYAIYNEQINAVQVNLSNQNDIDVPIENMIIYLYDNNDNCLKYVELKNNKSIDKYISKNSEISVLIELDEI